MNKPATTRGSKDEPVPLAHPKIEVGSILVSLLEPERGREAELHRWYERDHFYAGCMILPYFFSGRRYVATRELKELRAPEGTPVLEHHRHGSYLALYWMLAGNHWEAVEHSVRQVHWLNENGRMLPGRMQSHAGFYHRRFSVNRDEDGVPPELALEHPYPGLVLLMSDRKEGIAADEFQTALRDRAAEVMPGTPAALCIGFEPEPLPDDAPAYVRRPPGLERRFLQIFFLESEPPDAWAPIFSEWDGWLRGSGLGQLSLAAPFIPTVPGTDRYSDELW